jgi:hypothetical protein
MMTPIIRIISRDSAEDMIAAANSAAWFGKQQTFASAEAFVVVHPGTRRPFFIAKIEEVVPVPESGERRWALRFREYAELAVAEYDIDASSNPAIKRDLEQILPGMTLDGFAWKLVGSPSIKWSFSNNLGQIRESRMARPLTIAEARAGLSIGLGVPEDQIEIIVRG